MPVADQAPSDRAPPGSNGRRSMAFNAIVFKKRITRRAGTNLKSNFL